MVAGDTEPNPGSEPVPTAEPAGSDAEPETGAAAAEKDQSDESAPSPGYGDFEPASTPG